MILFSLHLNDTTILAWLIWGQELCDVIFIEGEEYNCTFRWRSKRHFKRVDAIDYICWVLIQSMYLANDTFIDVQLLDYFKVNIAWNSANDHAAKTVSHWNSPLRFDWILVSLENCKFDHLVYLLGFTHICLFFILTIPCRIQKLLSWLCSV